MRYELSWVIGNDTPEFLGELQKYSRDGWTIVHVEHSVSTPDGTFAYRVWMQKQVSLEAIEHQINPFYFGGIG